MISIRPAIAKDAVPLCHMRQEIWYEQYPSVMHGITCAVLEATFQFTHKATIKKVMQMITGHIPGYSMFVVEVDKQMIGFAVIAHGDNKIEAMNISTQYRNQGFGSQLLAHTLQAMDSTRQIILWVVSYNHAAIKFYQHHGFGLTPLMEPTAVIDFPLKDNIILPIREMRLL